MFSNIFWPQKVFSFFRNHISFQIYFGLKKVFEIIIPIPKGIKIPLRRENHCVLCKLSTMVIFSSFIKHTSFQIYSGFKKVFQIIIQIPKGVKIPLLRGNHCALCKLSAMVIFCGWVVSSPYLR